jgi:superfamily II DNA or RNA helicase
VVMADTLDHLSKLQLLCGQAGIPGEDMGNYTGEISKNKELLRFNAGKRLIFATYGMTAEGTDYPHWDTLVLATPRANVKQPVGRILRSNPGKKTPVVLDLVDDGSIFYAFAYKRQTTYHSLGAEVVKL